MGRSTTVVSGSAKVAPFGTIQISDFAPAVPSVRVSMRLGSMPFSFTRYALVLTARIAARFLLRLALVSLASVSPTTTAFESGSRCNRRATSSRIAFAVLSTRGLYGLVNGISLILLAVGGGGGLRGRAAGALSDCGDWRACCRAPAVLSRDADCLCDAFAPNS